MITISFRAPREARRSSRWRGRQVPPRLRQAGCQGSASATNGSGRLTGHGRHVPHAQRVHPRRTAEGSGYKSFASVSCFIPPAERGLGRGGSTPPAVMLIYESAARSANQTLDRDNKTSLWSVHATAASADGDTDLRGGCAQREFHCRRGRAGNDAGGRF